MSEQFSLEKAQQTPIPPRNQTRNWQQLPIEDNGEPLVAIGPLSDYGQILTSGHYFDFNAYLYSPYFQPNLAREQFRAIHLRQGVAERLVQAQKLLPITHRLVLLNGYRSLADQQKLVDYISSNNAQAGKLVTAPCEDPSCPPPHLTGGAVDITLVELSPEDGELLAELDQLTAGDKRSDFALHREGVRGSILRERGNFLSFSSGLDPFWAEAELELYEIRAALSGRGGELPIRRHHIDTLQNRRTLFHLMTAAGFAADYNKWWHYNAPETQKGAAAVGLDKAYYGAVIL